MSDPIDHAKIAEALQRPGIDSRSFVSLAIVTAISIEENGVIADVTLLPSQIEEHATLAPEYAGSGYGFYFPLEVDQMVIVEAPEGDPAHGLRITARSWDQGEPPPPDVKANPTDVLMFVKKDATCRLLVSGSGNLVVAARGTGKVVLGDEAADQDVVVQSALDAFMAAIADSITATSSSGTRPAPPTNAMMTELQLVLLALPGRGTPAAPPPADGWVAGTKKTVAG